MPSSLFLQHSSLFEWNESLLTDPLSHCSISILSSPSLFGKFNRLSPSPIKTIRHLLATLASQPSVQNYLLPFVPEAGYNELMDSRNVGNEENNSSHQVDFSPQIHLSAIASLVLCGAFSTVESLEDALCLPFLNALVFHGESSFLGQTALESLACLRQISNRYFPLPSSRSCLNIGGAEQPKREQVLGFVAAGGPQFPPSELDVNMPPSMLEAPTGLVGADSSDLTYSFMGDTNSNEQDETSQPQISSQQSQETTNSPPIMDPSQREAAIRAIVLNVLASLQKMIRHPKALTVLKELRQTFSNGQIEKSEGVSVHRRKPFQSLRLAWLELDWTLVKIVSAEPHGLTPDKQFLMKVRQILKEQLAQQTSLMTETSNSAATVDQTEKSIGHETFLNLLDPSRVPLALLQSATEAATTDTPPLKDLVPFDERPSLLRAIHILRTFDTTQGAYFLFPFLSLHHVQRIAAPVDLQTLWIAAYSRGSVGIATVCHRGDLKQRALNAQKTETALPVAAQVLLTAIELIVDNSIALNGPSSTVTTAAAKLRAELPRVLADVGLAL